MSTDGNDDLERRSLIRAVRQELESLGRAGLDRMPAWKSEHSFERDQSLEVQPNEAARRFAEADDGSGDSHPGSVPPEPASPPAPPPTVAKPAPSTSRRERPSRVPPAPASAALFGAPQFETAVVPRVRPPGNLGNPGRGGFRLSEVSAPGGNSHADRVRSRFELDSVDVRR